MSNAADVISRKCSLHDKIDKKDYFYIVPKIIINPIK